MKKLLMGLGLIVLLAGCASQDNGMGGTGDESNQSMKTDTYNNNNNNTDTSPPSDQFLNGTQTPTVAPSGSQPGQGVP
jgi:major membrane immunogen (membrane-anchored lipoprotein)